MKAASGAKPSPTFSIKTLLGICWKSGIVYDCKSTRAAFTNTVIDTRDPTNLLMTIILPGKKMYLCQRFTNLQIQITDLQSTYLQKDFRYWKTNFCLQKQMIFVFNFFIHKEKKKKKTLVYLMTFYAVVLIVLIISFLFPPNLKSSDNQGIDVHSL